MVGKEAALDVKTFSSNQHLRKRDAYWLQLHRSLVRNPVVSRNFLSLTKSRNIHQWYKLANHMWLTYRVIKTDSGRIVAEKEYHQTTSSTWTFTWVISWGELNGKPLGNTDYRYTKRQVRRLSCLANASLTLLRKPLRSLHQTGLCLRDVYVKSSLWENVYLRLQMGTFPCLKN